MEAYCMKCKEKREIQNPVAGFNTRATPVTTGTCGVCGTKLYRIGRTEAHEGLVPPEPVNKPRKREKEISEKCAGKTQGQNGDRGITGQSTHCW